MSKIRVLLDAQPMASGQKAGIGYYTAGLVSAMAASDPTGVELIGHYFDFLGRLHPELPKAANINYRVSRIIPRQLPNLLKRWGIDLPFEFFIKTRGDIIIYPGSTGPSSFFKTPIVPVVHDLTYLDLPQQVSGPKQKDLQRFVPGLLKNAPFIITISRATEGAIKKHYPWLKKPIVVQHIPPTELEKLSKDEAVKSMTTLKIKKPFILFVSTLEPRKNVINLISAYDLLPPDLKKRYSLVLAGGRGWNDREIRSAIVKAQSGKNDVIETGYVSVIQKSALYAKASLLVAPSFYEGYGMPLLEAMSVNVPVAASNIAVFREVAGPAAEYFNPNDLENIASVLAQVLSDKKTRDRLTKAGRQRVKELSWDKMAASILKQIRESIDRL